MNEVWLSVLLRFLCLYWVSWQPSPFAYIQSGGGRAGLGRDRSLSLVCLASMHLKALSLLLGVREEEVGIKLWQEGVELGKLLMWAGSRVSGGSRSNGCRSRESHRDLQHLLQGRKWSEEGGKRDG